MVSTHQYVGTRYCCWSAPSSTNRLHRSSTARFLLSPCSTSRLRLWRPLCCRLPPASELTGSVPSHQELWISPGLCPWSEVRASQRRPLHNHIHWVIDCICQRSSWRMRSPWRYQSFVSQDALYLLCGSVVPINLQFRRTALRYHVWYQETCPKPCLDGMMTLVSMKTRLKTKGLFDPNDVCAYRGQTVYCTTELCLSVDKIQKDNRQGRNDVSVQCPCLCNVQSVTC